MKKQFYEVVCTYLDTLGDSWKIEVREHLSDGRSFALDRLKMRARDLLTLLIASEMPLHVRPLVEQTILRHRDLLSFPEFTLEDEIEKMFKADPAIETIFQPLIDFALRPLPPKLSYKWTHLFHTALQPLLSFTATDGTPIMTGRVARSPEHYVLVSELWERTQLYNRPKRDYGDFMDMGPRTDEVCQLSFYAGACISLADLYYDKLQKVNSVTHFYELFTRILSILQNHAIQDIDPEAAERLFKKFSGKK